LPPIELENKLFVGGGGAEKIKGRRESAPEQAEISWSQNVKIFKRAGGGSAREGALLNVLAAAGGHSIEHRRSRFAEK